MDTINNKTQYHFFLFLFIAVAVLLFFIFRPFLTPLVLALSFAIVFEPVYVRISKMVGGKESIAAVITVAIVILIVLVPVVLIGTLLFNEARSLYITLINQGAGTGVLAHTVNVLQKYVHKFSPTTTIDISEYARHSLEWVVLNLNTFFSSFLKIALSLLIMIFSLFYLLRDGKRLKRAYIRLSPLTNEYDESILTKIASAIASVIKGSLIIAVIQGILAAIGLYLFGIPNPIIFGVAAMIASLIPGIGTTLVMGPVIIFLFLSGQINAGIGLLIWQIAVVSLIDNFLSPHLIERGLKVHPFFILISVLGGLALFGPIGFILGPVVLAFFFALLDIYPLINK
jgi:predicted PurR-regulated permease PerM